MSYCPLLFRRWPIIAGIAGTTRRRKYEWQLQEPHPELILLAHRSLVVSEKNKMGIINDFFFPVVYLTRAAHETTKRQYRSNESASNNVTQLPAASDWSCILQNNIEYSVVVVPACSRPLPLLFLQTQLSYTSSKYLRTCSAKRGISLTRECLYATYKATYATL